ncbi:hypothetical protein B0H66DRAFT_356289 [Apodospora peruviana]|uniref:Uncharacterized protein n=1 Tax=Apodospora peruviana TaxID=516989 RepID=A0AAE0LZN6_9PEZI|nr:hypothetical protein B0H66DRAFT_356289 [Apodospora peruviana]
MGVQLEPLSQSSFEQHGPWHFHDIRFKQDGPIDLNTALLQAASIPGLNSRLCELSKPSKGRYQQGSSRGAGESSLIPRPSKSMSRPLSSSVLSTNVSASTTTTSSKSTIQPNPSTPLSTFVFGQIVPKGTKILTFPIEEQVQSPRAALKRRRPDTDVDGPNTASLSCKKRRLLRHLITSRLSQPFSLPATHIINRECVASGDKRFLKLAAILAARRLNSGGAQQPPQLHPSLSSLLRRAAVINRCRLRVRAEAAERSDAEVANLAGNAVLLQQSHGIGSVVGAGFPLATPPASACSPTPIIRVAYQGQPHVLSKTGIVWSSPPNSSLVLHPTEPTGPLLRPPPSPRPIALRSPEPRSSRPLMDVNELDDLDDEIVAFPTSEYESRYDDDSDDVYTDFSVIFGSGEGDMSDEETSNEHVEDFMDDLDGIPWNARC